MNDKKPLCFGTKEYSEKQCICLSCDYYVRCGMIENKIKVKKVPIVKQDYKLYTRCD